MPVVYPLPFPFYTGDVDDTSADVPSTYPIGLAGRPYNLDLASEQFAHQGIDILKPQSDDSGQVDESSLNPEGLWRRSQDSWHKGAGQTYLDKPNSDSARFRSSLGIDPWTEGEISLLPGTFKTYNVTGGLTGDNLKLIVAGDFVYASVDTQLFRFSDPLNDTVMGSVVDVDINIAEPDRDILSLASDGNFVYAALGLNGIHRTARGTSSSEHYSDLEASLVGYTLGRLMAARQSSIYNVVATGTAPSPLFTHPNPDFTWVGFAEGKGHIFSAGYSGDKSLIYKTAIKPDGTELEVPSVSTPLPDGEIVRSIYGYLGFIFIGTDNGVRFAIPDTAGNLEVGALIKTDHPVRCFEGQDSFVWFGWTNYDNTHTGLGRCDIRTIVGGVAPAFATDLMANVQGNVTSVITFNGRRLFSVAANGTYVESLSKVASGTIDSGLISYGIPEEKIAIYLDVRYRELYGSDAVYLAKRDGVFTLLGTNTALSTSTQFQANSMRSDFLEIRHVLSRDAVITRGPVLTRHTLKSQVTANMGSNFVVPILLAEHEDTPNGQKPRDVMEEFLFLAGLSTDKSTVTFQYLHVNFTVTVEQHEFKPTHLNSNRTGYNGTIYMKLKVVV